MTERAARSADIAEWLPLPPRVFAILLILAQGRCHGYRLMQELLEGRAGEPWVVGPATLYRNLRQLELKGLIAGRVAEGVESDGPPRREYALTERGRRVAAAEAARMAHLVGMASQRRLVEPA